MNRLIQLRNEIAEAYRQHNDDLAFELEEQYQDCANDLSHHNRKRQQYSFTKHGQACLIIT